MKNATLRHFVSLTRRPGMLLLWLAAAVLGVGAAHAQDDPGKPWVSTWGAATSSATNDRFFPLNSYNGNDMFTEQTVRLIVHASIGGNQVRIRLSNELGTMALHIGTANIALTDTGAAVVPGSGRPLTFYGGTSPSVTIPPGAPVLSDPVALDIPANALLTVSLYLPGTTTITSGHSGGREDTYVTPVNTGDVTSAVSIPLDATDPAIEQWPVLTGVEVRARGARTFVAVGSSITNGTLSTLNANHRWTDYLSQRFSRHGMPIGVVNASGVANALTVDLNGNNVFARFDRDVLARPGVAWVFINDVIAVEFISKDPATGLTLTADQIIGELRTYIARVHSQGLKAYVGTICPQGGAPSFTPDFENKRTLINAFIRGGAFDGYADFDAAVRDPSDPTRILPAYDGGDHHHFTDLGYKVIADSFDLSLFQ